MSPLRTAVVGVLAGATVISAVTVGLTLAVVLAVATVFAATLDQ